MSIDSTNFTENAEIASRISEINQNLKKALSLNRYAALQCCPKAVNCCSVLFKYLNNAAADPSSILIYYEGYHAYLKVERKNNNILNEINNELIDFINNYRSRLTLNELKQTLITNAIIKDEEEDELY
jgi:hypothetical protein